MCVKGWDIKKKLRGDVHVSLKLSGRVARGRVTVGPDATAPDSFGIERLIVLERLLIRGSQWENESGSEQN